MKNFLLKVSLSLTLIFSIVLYSKTVYGAETSKKNIQVIAHRGDSGNAPEHTIEAYELARKLGSDYIEIDLGMTNDGQLIAIHDDTVDRTTNGNGRVSSLTLSQIKVFDTGSWFNKLYPDKAKPQFIGLKIPTLEEIIHKYGDTINYYIEIKKPEDHPSMTDELLKVLKSHHLIEDNTPRGKVIIESFDAESLKYIHSQYPNLLLVQLGDDSGQMDLLEISKYANGVGPHFSSVNQEFIENAHNQGLNVHCWTVNNQADMKRMIDWGVDGIFTNYVGLAVKLSDLTAPVVPTTNTVSDQSTIITGKAESNTQVYAWAGRKMLGEATASNGMYSIKISKQKAETAISVYSVDEAGNKSGFKTIKVLDRTAPFVPSINTISDQSTYITGKAESKSKVYAGVGSKKLGVATASNGKYSIKISKQKAGTWISVYSVDAAGNKSGKKTVKVLDRTAPKTPTVNKVMSKNVYIKGKAEKMAGVYVYIKSKKIGTGKVDSKGNFNVKIKPQKKKSKLTIYVKDSAGNKSKVRSVKVY